MTPLDCALRRGFRSTAKYLQLHGGVPASRLHNSQQQNVNSAVSMQIRDDITFWGDTSSDSERENGELNKHFMKTQKKKLSQKFKRKRPSVSGSELDDRLSAKFDKHRSGRKHSEKSRFSNIRNDSASSLAAHLRKSSKSRFDYSNEIVINGNTEINIHQSRAISVGRHTDVPIDQQIHEKLVSSKPITSSKGMYSRPKSAKHAVKKTNRSDSDRSSTSKSSASNSSRKLRNEGTKDLKLKDQATNTIEKMKDRASSIQVSKNDVAVITDEYLIDSLREPTSKFNFQSSRMSDTSEDQIGQQNIIVEASIHEPPNTEGKESTEEITEEPVADKKFETSINEISEEPQNDSTPKQDDENYDDENASKQEINETGAENKEDLNQLVEHQEHEKTEENIIENKEVVDPKSEEQKEKCEMNVNEETKEHTDDDKSDDKQMTDNEKSKKLRNLKRILSHDTFLRNQEPSEETPEMNENTEDSTNPELSLIKLNIEQELSLKIHGTDQDAEDCNKTEETSSKSDIMNTGDTTVRQISEDKLHHTENIVEEATVTKEDEDLMEKAFGETITEDILPSDDDLKSRRGVSRPRDSLMKTPTPEDSTISSLGENRAHQSFTVLEDKELEETKTTKRKSGNAKIKKQRSKSEEHNRKSDKESRRPSKIPTPIGKTMMLSKSERSLNRIVKNVELNKKIPSLPEVNNLRNDMNETYRSQSNMQTRRGVSIFSDDKGTGSEDEEKERVPTRRRKVKRKTHRRDSRSAGSDYESSNVIDSGFEPSPRSVRVPRWRNMSERGVNMTSVTQNIQSNIRRLGQ